MARLGDPDLSWIAAHQSIHAAHEADDPALMAASAWRVCHAVLRVDNLDEVYNVATTAAASYDRCCGSRPQRACRPMALHLVGAVAAARADDQAAADGFLGEARRTAARLGADRNDFWMTFGPTHVAIHDVAVLLERGDPTGRCAAR